MSDVLTPTVDSSTATTSPAVQKVEYWTTTVGFSKPAQHAYPTTELTQ